METEFKPCTVCGTAPEPQANGMLYHPCLVEHSEQQCPLEATESEPGQWRTLMGQGEAVDDKHLKLLLRQVFEVCEATEESEPKNDFERGRAFEAKHIRKAIGSWFQDYFCGRARMGDPVISITPQPAVDDAVLRDAQRYRWLRDRARTSEMDTHGIYIGVDSDKHKGRWALFEDRADKAIDAAMKGA